mmetsp:Transcript_34710/g.109002  ORF Transcript_34710/g.109002 Transcript_34710/m.109002 type:complete len:195 (-) Transcript_34710:81-665(-)
MTLAEWLQDRNGLGTWLLSAVAMGLALWVLQAVQEPVLRDIQMHSPDTLMLYKFEHWDLAYLRRFQSKCGGSDAVLQFYAPDFLFPWVLQFFFLCSYATGLDEPLSLIWKLPLCGLLADFVWENGGVLYLVDVPDVEAALWVDYASTGSAVKWVVIVLELGFLFVASIEAFARCREAYSLADDKIDKLEENKQN